MLRTTKALKQCTLLIRSEAAAVHLLAVELREHLPLRQGLAPAQTSSKEPCDGAGQRDHSPTKQELQLRVQEAPWAWCQYMMREVFGQVLASTEFTKTASSLESAPRPGGRH